MATVDKYFKVKNGLQTPSAVISHYLHTPGITFNTASPSQAGIGILNWDDGEGGLTYGAKGGNVNISIGKENVALCYNGSASAFNDGDVVRIIGAQGQRPSMALAVNTFEATSSKTFGVITEPINPGEEGFVTTFGIVNNVNTSNFAEGAALWLSSSAGKLTTDVTQSPQHLVFVGYCLKSAPSSGRIFVNPQNGYELEELHNVAITSVADNQILQWNQSASLWMNSNLITAITELDGSGSGLDADFLDGFNSSYFLNTSSAAQETWGHFTFHDHVTIGNLTVTGSYVFISAADLSITDSIIYLADSQFNEDVLDIGIYGAYGDENSGHFHTGLIRDASDGIWKLFSGGDEPSNSLVDFSSVDFDTLKLGSIIVSSSARVDNLNSQFLDSYSSSDFLLNSIASQEYLSKSNASATYTNINDFSNLEAAIHMGVF